MSIMQTLKILNIEAEYSTCRSKTMKTSVLYSINKMILKLPCPISQATAYLAQQSEHDE